jgi:hypothetical protein
MPMKNPPHPGDLIRTEVVEALGLTVSKASEILQVRRAHLLRMQLAYDVAKARARTGPLNQAVCSGLNQRFPYAYTQAANHDHRSPGRIVGVLSSDWQSSPLPADSRVIGYAALKGPLG